MLTVTFAGLSPASRRPGTTDTPVPHDHLYCDCLHDGDHKIDQQRNLNSKVGGMPALRQLDESKYSAGRKSTRLLTLSKGIV